MLLETPIPRAVALVLAGLSVASAAGAATPERLGRGEPAAVAESVRTPRLVPLERVTTQSTQAVVAARLPRGRSKLSPADLPVAIERAAERALARGGRFPVAGPFNWGQTGARFGAARGARAHEGHDLFGRTGTPLVAVTDGVVTDVDEDGGRGNYVAIHDPATNLTYVYLHLRRPAHVRRAQRVRGGQSIGELGCTGSCYGDHLHFEVRHGRGTEGEAEDPLPRLRSWARSSGARATLPAGAR